MSFEKLYYQGKEVLLDQKFINYEIWFVNKNNFIIAKVRAGEPIGFLKRWYIYLKTLVSEWLGQGKDEGETWLNWNKKHL